MDGEVVPQVVGRFVLSNLVCSGGVIFSYNIKNIFVLFLNYVKTWILFVCSKVHFVVQRPGDEAHGQISTGQGKQRK